MEKINIVLCGSIETSSSNKEEKVGVVSVVYASTDSEATQRKLKELQKNNPNNYYMDYEIPLDTDLTFLNHYPSLEISREDLNS